MATTGGRHPPGQSRGFKINSAAAVLQAAIDGQGIGLARKVMAQDGVAAGRLVGLFPKTLIDSTLPTTGAIAKNAARPRIEAIGDRLT